MGPLDRLCSSSRPALHSGRSGLSLCVPKVRRMNWERLWSSTRDTWSLGRAARAFTSLAFARVSVARRRRCCGADSVAGSRSAPGGCDRPCGGDAMCCGAPDTVLLMGLCSSVAWHDRTSASIDCGVPAPRPFGSPQRVLCARSTSSASVPCALAIRSSRFWRRCLRCAASRCLRSDAF